MAPRSKVSPRTIKLTANARSALRSAITHHPNVLSFVRTSSEVVMMKKAELLRLADQLGIDVEKVIKSSVDSRFYSAEDEASMSAPPAFEGSFEFDLEISLLGKTVKRKARIAYENTPDWAYYDPSSGREVLGWESSAIGIDVLVPDEGKALELLDNGRIVKRKSIPQWITVDIVQPGIFDEEIWDEIYRLVNEQCRTQNAARMAEGPTKST